MKIATIVGARPQFIKAAALSRSLKKSSQTTELLIHTGQHYDSNMSEIFFQEMEIPHPDYHLNIGGLSHGAMTGRMIEAIEEVLLKEQPNWVLVYGDTNSTLAGALAAVKLHIPVAHVEAGLRSYNRKMPEEINRILTDQCSDCLFTPSPHSTRILQKEGIASHKIHEIGDIMYDAALHYKAQAASKSKILSELKLTAGQYALATIHRAENNENPKRLKEIFQGLLALAKHLEVILPLHPKTKKILLELGLFEECCKTIRCINPVGYFDMISLESSAKVILTDSGGVQKEAYFFKVPCLTLREETEWVELVELGFNKLVKASKEDILESAIATFSKKYEWNTPIYGDGTASTKIIQALKDQIL